MKRLRFPHRTKILFRLVFAPSIRRRLFSPADSDKISAFERPWAIPTRSYGQIHFESSHHSGDDPRRQQGVASQFEEIVMYAYPIEAKTSAQIAAISVSIGVPGGTNGLSSSGRFRAGAGRRRRSVFPFGVFGSASMTTNADGII